MTDTNDSTKNAPSVVPGAEPLLVLKSLVAAVDPNDQLSLLKLARWFKEIPATIPPDTRPPLDEARLLVLRMTGNDRTPEKTLADLAALVDRVVKSVETKSAPAPAAAPPPKTVVTPDEETPADQDRLLFVDFIPEAGEHLQAAESALLTLEKAPSDSDAINTVFRAFHTLKGMAGYVHLRFCTDLAHHAESLLSKVREKEMAYGPGIADLSLRSIDVMKFLIESVQAASQGGSIRKPVGYDDLLGLLKNATEKGVVDPPHPIRGNRGAAPPRSVRGSGRGGSCSPSGPPRRRHQHGNHGAGSHRPAGSTGERGRRTRDRPIHDHPRPHRH